MRNSFGTIRGYTLAKFLNEMYTILPTPKHRRHPGTYATRQIHCESCRRDCKYKSIFRVYGGRSYREVPVGMLLRSVCTRIKFVCIPDRNIS